MPASSRKRSTVNKILSSARAYLQLEGKQSSVEIDRHDDFTIILSQREYDLLASAASKSSGVKQIPIYSELQKASFQDTICLPVVLAAPKRQRQLARITGRALICICNVGAEECASITLRVTGCSKGPPLSGHKKRWLREKYKRSHQDIDQWVPDNNHGSYPQSIDEQVQSIVQVLKSADVPQGLLVIAGATGTGKSQIAKGLIHRILGNCWGERRRRAHVVTLEDPIEEKTLFKNLESAQRGWADYTARTKGKPISEGQCEYPSLADAARDVMRQTPAVFYAGETRETKDWKELLWLANTGHLVVTTTHAASIVDYFKMLSGIVPLKTPADRSEIAGRIFAIVHLESFHVNAGRRISTSSSRTSPKKRQREIESITLPSVWLRSAKSLSELISDGLASVTPHTSSSSTATCFGRSYFAKAMAAKLRPRFSQASIQAMVLRAISADLEGTQS